VRGEDMINRVSQQLLCTYTALMRNIPQTELSRVFANKNRHVRATVKACQGSFLTFVVTRGSMRNVFYYGPSQNVHSLQYAHSTF
jgi:hypothetical protein